MYVGGVPVTEKHFLLDTGENPSPSHALSVLTMSPSFNYVHAHAMPDTYVQHTSCGFVWHSLWQTNRVWDVRWRRGCDGEAFLVGCGGELFSITGTPSSDKVAIFQLRPRSRDARHLCSAHIVLICMELTVAGKPSVGCTLEACL